MRPIVSGVLTLEGKSDRFAENLHVLYIFLRSAAKDGAGGARHLCARIGRVRLFTFRVRLKRELSQEARSREEGKNRGKPFETLSGDLTVLGSCACLFSRVPRYVMGVHDQVVLVREIQLHPPSYRLSDDKSRVRLSKKNQK